ncbi:MAG: ATP-binding protein, partial [Mariprofundaceae bacterium]|nr:ATP-binding protein [Mariprofundaceae bacterium]
MKNLTLSTQGLIRYRGIENHEWTLSASYEHIRQYGVRNIISGVDVTGRLNHNQAAARRVPNLGKHARRIGEASLRASDLTRNMLGFARKGEMRRESVNVFALLREVAQMLGETSDKRIHIDLRGDTDGRVLGDPGQLHQVFMNLCINAMQAMPQGGELVFDVHCEAERVLVRVSDTGCGMSDEV